MIRSFALLLFAAAAASAQMQLMVVDAPGSEKPVSNLYQIGSAAVGDRVDTTFRVRNTSQSTSLVIRSLTLGGAAFTMFGQPSLPHTIAPGLNMDFTVRFSPRDFGSYSANLSVNGAALLLAGTSAAAPTLSADGNPLQSGSSVDLGLVERGTTASKSFHLENTTSERVRVQATAITGKYFRLAQELSMPLELAPHTSIDFNLLFAPAASGVFEGALVIDGRTYRLTGAANEPPFPKPAIVVDLPNPTSGQQGRVSVRFGQASRAIGSGKLSIEFRPSVNAVLDDEAVKFLRGDRTGTFRVEEGTEAPVSELTFQTGTTAGTIVFTAEVGGWSVNTSVEIAPERVRIDKTRAVRNASMLEIEITGYDNNHAPGQLSFTFYNSKGAVVQPGAITVDSSPEFRKYFEKSTLGGAFTLKAVFPVAGQIADIASVEVELVNPAGATRSGKVQIQ
jgi:hypothetical protein